MRKLIIPVFLACVLMGLSGCEDKQAQGPAMAPPVAVYDVKVEDYPWSAQYQAQASGSKSVEVRARVEALIEKRLYKEGDYVTEGQQLFHRNIGVERAGNGLT